MKTLFGMWIMFMVMIIFIKSRQEIAMHRMETERVISNLEYGCGEE